MPGADSVRERHNGLTHGSGVNRTRVHRIDCLSDTIHVYDALNGWRIDVTQSGFAGAVRAAYEQG